MVRKDEDSKTYDILVALYDSLTGKQQRFVDYYDGNASQAADKAGYSNPRQAGSENMAKPDIKKAIQARETIARHKHIWTRKERQRFWTRVASGKETQPAVVGQNDDGNDIIIDIPAKMAERLKASELLARSEADFTDKVALGALGKDGQVKGIEVLFITPPQPKEITHAPEG